MAINGTERDGSTSLLIYYHLFWPSSNEGILSLIVSGSAINSEYGVQAHGIFTLEDTKDERSRVWCGSLHKITLYHHKDYSAEILIIVCSRDYGAYISSSRSGIFSDNDAIGFNFENVSSLY